MGMTTEEFRDFLIRAFNPRTERDDQIEVGASNLSDPCARERAYAIVGRPRSEPVLDGAFGGRVIGTAIHAHIEKNLKNAEVLANPDGGDLARLGAEYPGLHAERHLTLGNLTPERVVTSTTDIYIESRGTVGDTKSTDLRKMAFMVDAVSMMSGNGPIFGRGHRFVEMYREKETGVWRKIVDGVSEREYASQIEHAKYKLSRYSNQLHLYAYALENEGKRVDDLHVGLVARDSAMTCDGRDSVRYLDENAPWGIRAIRFSYSRDYAAGLWKEAQAMAKALESGAKSPLDYPSHPLCAMCEAEAKREAKQDRPIVEAAQLEVADPWAA